ncbi:hypothetical protein OUZ56_022821 [Daphnia magna]|uniref:G-protein coupled receptors family 1 profile domain-containing protein n=1 Tax=Daphnia magna TaxID=35525 RepID=A0ABR0AXK4_9CRUS|nr:hypothetical protein OUZ56_022821 [Daphnia magna]
MAAEWRLLMMTMLPVPLVSSSSHPPWSSSASFQATLFLASTSSYPVDDDYVDGLSGNVSIMMSTTTTNTSTHHSNSHSHSQSQDHHQPNPHLYEGNNLSSLATGAAPTGDDVMDDERFPAYVSLLMMLSCGLILVVGLVGNCLVPVVIWNNRDLRNSTNLFLLNLSLADILVLCVSMPTVLVEIYERRDTWIFGKVMFDVAEWHSFRQNYINNNNNNNSSSSSSTTKVVFFFFFILAVVCVAVVPVFLSFFLFLGREDGRIAGSQVRRFAGSH